MEIRKTVVVSESTLKKLKVYAGLNLITIGEAADRLVTLAIDDDRIAKRAFLLHSKKTDKGNSRIGNKYPAHGK